MFVAKCDHTNQLQWKIWIWIRECLLTRPLSSHCRQALGVCSRSDRSAMLKKLKEMKKREEKEQRKEDKRLKEKREKEKNAVLEKESVRTTMEEKCVKDVGRSGKTVRTESLL